jgi:hypothetical protein
MQNNISLYNNHDNIPYIVKCAHDNIKAMGLCFEIRLYDEVFNVLNLGHVLKTCYNMNKNDKENKLYLEHTNGTTLFENMKKTDGKYLLNNPNVFFQIVWMLHIFQQAGIFHHDLHFRNIIVEERTYYSFYKYILDDDRMFQGWSNTHVYIIDFDHGTKVYTDCNKTIIKNEALTYWTDVGARNTKPLTGFDWFTFLYYLSTYNTIYEQYVQMFSIPDIQIFPEIKYLLFPGRPLTKYGICFHILQYIKQPITCLNTWRVHKKTDILNSNIKQQYHIPLPPFPVFVYNQHLPQWCYQELIKNKHHTCYSYEYNNKQFILLFRWCGVFSTFPQYLHYRRKEYWLLFLTYKNIKFHKDIIYICKPYMCECYEIHRRIKNKYTYITTTKKKCLFECAFKTPVNVPITRWHTWYPCMLSNEIYKMGLKWEYLIMPIHITSSSSHMCTL